jgi:hypothetical protein
VSLICDWLKHMLRGSTYIKQSIIFAKRHCSFLKVFYSDAIIPKFKAILLKKIVSQNVPILDIISLRDCFRGDDVAWNPHYYVQPSMKFIEPFWSFSIPSSTSVIRQVHKMVHHDRKSNWLPTSNKWCLYCNIWIRNCSCYLIWLISYIKSAFVCPLIHFPLRN